MWKHVVLCIRSVTLPLLVACTNGSDSGSVADAGACPAGGSWTTQAWSSVAADEVCQRIADLQCSAERCCCTTDARKYPTRDACMTTTVDACKKTAKTELVTTDARSGFDPAAAAVALERFQQYASGCDPEIVKWGISPDGLSSMLVGSVAAGKQCWTAAQGADAPAFASCENGYACLPDPGAAFSPWKCKPRAKLGETCLMDGSCQDSLRCEPNLSTNIAMLGRCMQRLSNGAACARGLECKSLFCESGKCAAPSVTAAYCLAPTK
jgi:hypothetical protein